MSNSKSTYKAAIEELEDIVNDIENENIDVDELAKKVDRASKLLKVCDAKLKKTEADVDKIIEQLNSEN